MLDFKKQVQKCILKKQICIFELEKVLFWVSIKKSFHVNYKKAI